MGEIDSGGKPRRVIVDVDVGADDYLALLMLFQAEKLNKVRIEAIVCTMGNTTVDNVCVNVVRLLEIIKRTDIPVYKGATKQLVPVNHEMRTVHGLDGFGDLKHDRSPDLSVIKKEPVATGIWNLVINNPNKISLICLGPLTNLALIIRLYDDFADSIKDLWIMGGNSRAVGNSSTTADFNFSVDPEAAHIVFESVKKSIFVLPWETCLLPNIPMDWHMEVFGAKNNPAFDLLLRAEKSIFDKSGRLLRMCDALLVAAFLYPNSVITEKSAFYATVELHGPLTRGQMVLDHLKTKEENVIIIDNIDKEAFKDIIVKL